MLISHIEEGYAFRGLTMTGKPERFASASATLMRDTDIIPKIASAGKLTDSIEAIGPPIFLLRIWTKSVWS